MIIFKICRDQSYIYIFIYEAVLLRFHLIVQESAKQKTLRSYISPQSFKLHSLKNDIWIIGLWLFQYLNVDARQMGFIGLNKVQIQILGWTCSHFLPAFALFLGFGHYPSGIPNDLRGLKVFPSQTRCRSFYFTTVSFPDNRKAHFNLTTCRWEKKLKRKPIDVCDLDIYSCHQQVAPHSIIKHIKAGVMSLKTFFLKLYICNHTHHSCDFTEIKPSKHFFKKSKHNVANVAYREASSSLLQQGYRISPDLSLPLIFHHTPVSPVPLCRVTYANTEAQIIAKPGRRNTRSWESTRDGENSCQGRAQRSFWWLESSGHKV